MTKIYIQVGQKIRKLRKQKDLSQEKLAELTHIDPKSIIDIEAGRRNPTLKTISKLSRALGVPPSELLQK